MRRLASLLTIAVVSALITPVVVNATGTPPKHEPAPALRLTAVQEVPAAEPVACRKVKVVYAGLGEGQQGCAQP
jgi:hypothetical protein